MTTQKHKILEQIIELTVQQPEDARAFHQQFGQIFRRRILPLIDRYCTELSDPDTLYRIDRLDLDIGEIDPNRFNLDFTEKVSRIFKPKLEEKIRLQIQQSGGQKGPLVTTSQLEMLQTFLATGTLPWWADEKDPDLLKDCVDYLLSHSAGTLQQLLKTSVKNETTLRRMIHHLGDDQLASLVPVMGKIPTSRLDSVLQKIIFAVTKITKLSQKAIRRATWEAVFHQMLHRGSMGFSFEQVIWNLVARFPVLQGEREQLGQQLEEDKTGFDGEFQAMGFTPPQEDQSTLYSVGDIDELYINNAGLVILWPYLIRFFEHVGWVSEEAFVDALAPHRAIALLQYLADSSIEPPEYLLPLNKLLCGIDLEAPFEADFSLDEGVLDTAEALLEAVISNAPILDEMSNDGFRNTFLRRAGILSFEDGHWMLRVERETYDIVLDRIPWSFKIVKLPWMEYILYVEW